MVFNPFMRIEDDTENLIDEEKIVKKKHKQSKADKMDESLGERMGKESGKKQSYQSRRNESSGMRKRKTKR